MKNKNLLIGVVVVVIAIGALYLYSHKSDGVVGAIGTNPIENYIPAIKYNEGYYSNLPVVTTAGATLGTSGTAIANYLYGTCTPSFSSADLAASTTAVGICKDASILGTETITATQIYRGPATGLPSYGLFPVLNIVSTTTGQYGIRVESAIGAATTSINSQYRQYSVTVVR